jgi:hypothetical protein
MSSKNRNKSPIRRKTNNVLLFKLIDPIGQSLLFILFIYGLDTDYTGNGGTPYNTTLYYILFAQIASTLINFFIKEENQLKNERAIYAVTITLYIVSFFFIRRAVPEKFIEVMAGDGMMQMPAIEIMLMGIGIVIAFWYFTICFREVRGLLKTQ